MRTAARGRWVVGGWAGSRAQGAGPAALEGRPPPTPPLRWATRGQHPWASSQLTVPEPTQVRTIPVGSLGHWWR